MIVSGAPQLFGFPHFENIIFSVQQTKENYTGLKQPVGE